MESEVRLGSVLRTTTKLLYSNIFLTYHTIKQDTKLPCVRHGTDLDTTSTKTTKVARDKKCRGYEPLVWAKACRDNGWNSIEDAGYGKGYVAALNLWRQYIDGLNALRDDRGMTVVQIAHTDIKRFDSPEHDPYDRYVIKLHARAAALLQEHSDVVLFANYRISTVKADVGFNKKVSRAVGSGERVIHTVERPAFLAKNRYDLPDTLPLEWSAFAQAMPETLHPTLIPSTTTRT